MILIDVRTKGEYDAGHAENSMLCDIMEMMAGKFPDVSKDEEIVLCCESGNRAMMAKTLMERAGFTNVTNGGCVENFM